MQNYQKFLYNEEYLYFVNYLKNIRFNDKLFKLSQKYKNKKILIYGTGILFDVISENYNLKKYLDICYVSDKKYEKENISEYKGFKTIKPAEIRNVEIDIILITTVNPTSIKEFLQKNNFVNKTIVIESIFKPLMTDRITDKKNKIKIAFKYFLLTKNIFNCIKYYFSLKTTEYEAKLDYSKKINTLKKDKTHKIRVLFLCEENAKWGYQSLYEEMKTDEGFEVLPILNLPIITKDRQSYTQNENTTFFKSFGMESTDGYDYEQNALKKIQNFNPDIIFYQQPWYVRYSQLPQILSKFALTCIVSYGYTSIDVKSWGSDAVRQFSGHLWKMFAESNFHNKFYQKAAKLRFKDILLTTGYPKFDFFYKPIDIRFEKIWKDENKSEKHRIIWAPHHSIDNYGLSMSLFKEQYKYFLEFAKKHPEYSFIVKPHPQLKYKCISEKFLTEEEYDRYISEWNNLPNASVYQEGNYFDLFKTSDLLITDCSSFLGEYFYSNKPIIFFERSQRADFNEFGNKIKKGLYILKMNDELENLLFKLLIKKEDNLKTLREKIIKKEYYYPECGVGKNIVKYIKKTLNR